MPSRPTAWADTIFLGDPISNNATKVVDLLVNAPTVDTLTAVRLVGNLDVGIAISAEVEFAAAVCIAIGVASVEAFDVGITALPNAHQQAEFPPRGWLYRDVKLCWQYLVSGAPHQKHNAHFEFDLRAARKIDKGRLFMLIRNSSDFGTTALDVTGIVRALCLT